MPIVVMLGAFLNMSAERGGSALYECARGLTNVCRQVVRALVCRVRLFEDRLNRVVLHKFRFFVPPFCKGGQGGICASSGQCKYTYESIKPVSKSIPASAV